MNQQRLEAVETFGLTKVYPSVDCAFWLSQIQCALLLTQVPEAAEAARLFLIWATQKDAPHSALTQQYLRESTSTLGHPSIVYPSVEHHQVSELLQSLVVQHAPEIRELL